MPTTIQLAPERRQPCQKQDRGSAITVEMATNYF
jgi:hypothetical protein